MPLASENPFPKLIVQEAADDGSDFTNPDADYRVLFLGEDGLLHLKDSAGTVTDVAASGLLNNYAASDAPDANDDSGDGYAVGSVWVDTTGDAAYICVDATPTSAVWLPFDSASGESWEGAWSAGSYTTGQIVLHDDIVYQANTTTSDEPPSADWDELFDGSGGGGGGDPLLYADSLTLGSNGDDFDGGTGAWTFSGASAGSLVTTEVYDDDTYDITFPAQSDRMYRAMFSADPGEAIVTLHGINDGTSPASARGGMLAIYFSDNSGNGTGMSIYNDGQVYMWGIASNAYTSTGNIVDSSGIQLAAPAAASGWPVMYRLNRNGTTITGGISVDGGLTWKTNTRTDATTFTRMGLIRLFSGGGSNPRLRVGRWNAPA